MNRWKEYVVALSEAEALAVLAEASGRGRVIAGGTDLVVQFRDGQRRADVLVDITQIESLKRITVDEGALSISAAVTHQELLEYLARNDQFPSLKGALSALGSPQIRNQGTVVGNVASGHGSADAGIALLALGGELVVLSRNGRRRVSLKDYYQAGEQPRLDSTLEIAVEVRVKIPPMQQKSAYARMGRRRGFSRPVISCAAVISIDGGRITEARIAVGPVLREPYRSEALAPCTQCFSACRVCRPFRVLPVEEYLIGKSPEPSVFTCAAGIASEVVTPRNSVVNGTSKYRRLVVEALVKRALSEAAFAGHHD
ncbi:MAG: hypothetical protein HPY55_07125 [Firmicutes bacterium]|nr:hypothetical protein [Bacillota bacterium]